MKYRDGGFSGPLRKRVAMMSVPLVTLKFSEHGFSISAIAHMETMVEIVWFSAATMSSTLEDPGGIKSTNRANMCSVSVLPLIILQLRSERMFNRLRRILLKDGIPPLCIKVKGPYLNGWQFWIPTIISSCGSCPDDAARTWPKNKWLRTWSPILRKFGLDHAGVTNLKQQLESAIGSAYHAKPNPSPLT